MREILFRGKRLDNGGWIEGSLWVNLDKPHILTPTNCIGYEVDPATVGQYSGKQIAENSVTDNTAYLHMKKVFEDDLIGIYTVGYDDEDNLIRSQIATVRVQWDKEYCMLFAQCVKGSMQDIADECDISYMETDYDIPFTYWLETMNNSNSQFWEWEIIGNIHDNPELLGGNEDG